MSNGINWPGSATARMAWIVNADDAELATVYYILSVDSPWMQTVLAEMHTRAQMEKLEAGEAAKTMGVYVQGTK